MNLFMIGWNLSQEERRRAAEALAAMHEAFPLLDASTVGRWDGRNGFACWMHHGPDAAGPRQYVHASAANVVLYDGIPVDTGGRYAAHEARQLSAHWDTLTDDLEGHFAAVRLDDENDGLEIINDPAGVHPTYVHRQGDRWWIANRVRLLAGAAGLDKADLEGIATFLAFSYPGADRTLVEGITKLPPAQRWRWHGAAPPVKTSYWPMADLARLRQTRFGPKEAATLAEEMGTPLRLLGTAVGRLDCPITAGHDTRVLTGLVMASGCPADYVTFGAPDDVDVILGTAIAQRFGLPHRRFESPVDRSPEEWEEVSRRIVQRNDGMISLMHARSTLDPPERLDGMAVTLYGGGGELARGKELSTSFLARPTVSSAFAIVHRVLGRGAESHRPEARELVRAHIERSCRALIDLGFKPVDLPDAVRLTERYPRWGANQAVQRADQTDVFVPFFGRAFIRTAFAVSPADRMLQRVPHHLIQHLSPALRSMPSGSQWPPNSVVAYGVTATWKRAQDRYRRFLRQRRPSARLVPARTRERIAILLNELPRWRERFLDRSEAVTWRVIDRERFEYLTSDRATDGEKAAQFQKLYLTATTLAFEEDLEAWTNRWR